MDFDLHDRWTERRGPQMRPPSRAQTRFALIVVAVAVGLLIGVQAAQQDPSSARLSAESPEDLARILADLNAEADELSDQVADLRLKLFRYEDSAQRDDLALRDARKTLRDLQVLAGSTEVRGPGLVLTISDPRAAVTWEPVLDLVQELRDAGAEALSINGTRVVASTWLGPGEGGLTVDGTGLSPPYRIEAIGAGEALAEALGIPGGPVSLLEAQSEVDVSLEPAESLRLPALQREITFRYARPAA